MGGIVWTDEALDNLEDITRYVRDFSPSAAARVESDIVGAVDSLLLMPERGRPIGRHRRELTITRPYVIRYVVVGDEVRILWIRHAARRPEA